MDRFRIQALEKFLGDGWLADWQQRAAMTELMSKLTIYGNGCLRHNKQDEGERWLARSKELIWCLEKP